MENNQTKDQADLSQTQETNKDVDDSGKHQSVQAARVITDSVVEVEIVTYDDTGTATVLVPRRSDWAEVQANAWHNRPA